MLCQASECQGPSCLSDPFMSVAIHAFLNYESASEVSMNPNALAHDQRGSVAVEYLIVSAFATMAALGVATFVGNIMKQKMDQMSQQLGIEADSDISFPSNDD